MSSDLAKRVELLEKQIALLLNQEPKKSKDDSSDDEKPKKAKKAPKADSSDDDKPKVKRTSGYILFCDATRDDVRISLNYDGLKAENTDVMKELAIMWKELLGDEERKEWNDLAQQVRD